jgi:NAD(P)-dependent dehydrogenase (short-subunit alcohol dehydrogenase family)
VADLKSSRLSGRVVLITGAESGIGRETALRAASDGADIAAVGLDSGGLESLTLQVRAMGRRAEARLADVSNAAVLTASVAELAGQLGPLHVAHANAGILTPATPIMELDLDEWNRVLAVNLTGVLLTFRASLPHRSRRRIAACDWFVDGGTSRSRAPAVCRREGGCARDRP